MDNQKYRIYAFGLMILLAVGTTAWAQTSSQTQQTIKTEVKAVEHNGVITVTAAGDPQSKVSTVTFVASEMGFESKVIKGVPFSADIVTEFTQVLGNGQRLYRNNTASLYRDSEGRTRREQTIEAIGPYAAAGPVHKTILINDPVAGESYVLNPDEHIATKTTINAGWVSSNGAVSAYFVRPGDPVPIHVSPEKVVIDGIKASGGGVVMGGTVTKVASPTNSRTEPLGTQVIEGVAAEGARTIETIPAGTIGNDTPIEIVSERWYSDELGMVVKTVHNDPMSGQNVYQLKNIRRGEPSPDLFQVPPDYTIKDATIKIQTIRK
jgi:hypothetical protein